MKRTAALAAAGLALLTTGCVAAVLPLAAGAALAKRHGELERPAVSRAPTSAAKASSGEARIIPTTLTALPPASNAPSGDPDVAAFAAYALASGPSTAPGARRTSAILPTASELRVARTPCGSLPAAVIVDLDPGRGTFDPLMPGTPDPALRDALASLRAKGLAVAWLSRLGTNFEAAAREVLQSSGLDPTGADTLLLLPDLSARKQSLRDQVAARFCPVAMLGDERADFDELYLYLKNPDTALALDAMIGRGWFLASPFADSASRGRSANVVAVGTPPEKP